MGDSIERFGQKRLSTAGLLLANPGQVESFFLIEGDVWLGIQ